MVASDGTLTDTKAVTVNVTNVNEAPTITSGSTGSVAENASTSTVVYTAAATDVDAGTTLVYSLSGTDSALFNINSSTGAVTLKASANYEAKSSYSINVVASDGTLTDTKAVTVNVTNVNEAPTVVNENIITDVASLTGFDINVLLANDSDVDLDAITATYLSTSGLTVTGTTTLDISSIATNDTLTYRVTDSALTTNGTTKFTLDTDGSMTGTNSQDDIFVVNGSVSEGGSGDSGTISAYDVITNFEMGDNDILDLSGSVSVIASAANSNGTNSSLTVAGAQVSKHSIDSHGMATFTDASNNSISIDSVAKVAAVVQYLEANDLGSGGTTLAFTASISSVSHTYIYSQTTGSAGGQLVDLSGVTASGITTSLTDTTSTYIHLV